MPYDKIDQLYDALKKDGAVSKSRENFRSKMLAPGKEGYQNRLQLYNALKADGAIDSPTYEEFGKRLGLHAVNNTFTPTKPLPQKPTAASAQAATPAPSTAPTTSQQKDKPLTPAQRQAMIDQVQQMQQQTQAMIADNNERMKNMKQYGFGLGFGQTKKGGIKYNPRTKKFEQTYITPTGNRYSSKALADMESTRYRQEASKPLGISMNDQQVNAAQKPANAAVAALWKEAEAKYAADRNKNAEEVYSGNPWLHAGREMHIVDAATNSHKNEVSRLTRFDLQKMMDNAWGRVGKQMTASCYQQLKKQYPTASEQQLQNSASAMARQLSDNAVYKYAVAKNTPKSTLEFFAKTAADMNLLRTITKGLARSEAGTTGDMAAYEQAMSDYGKNHRWAQIGGTVTGMMFDPTTYISGGIGSLGGKMALNVGGRIVAKKAATNVGARLFGNTLAGRVVAGSVGGGLNFGTYEGIKEGENQWLHGGHINPQTGENEGYSAGDILKSTGRGTILGSVTGTISPLLGNVADKWVKATSNTAGKMGIRAGELATSTVAEGTIFSIPEWINGDGDAMDVWTDNMSMMLGFKAQHMVKSAPRVIAGLRPIENPRTMQERNHNRMSFLERLRTQLDASPRDMAFTKEEREELQKYGYGDLAALFTRTPKQQPKAKAKQPTTTDGKVMNFDIPEAEVEDLGKQWLKTHPEFDGYEAMQRLIQDPSVSQSARAKAYYILTGHQLPMGTVTGYTTEKDEHGNIFVKSVTANGEVVTNRRFADEASAKREQDKIMRQAELNSVDVGERYTEAKADNKVWDAAVEAVAPDADPETVKRNYQAAKEGDKDAIANYGQMVDAIDKFMEENRGMADAERPEAIRAAIKEETGVDVDAAIKKEPSKRTEPEQAAVEDYLKRLFPEQNQETEQPMSDDEAGAAAIYDQSRLLWDKVEQGDADAKADVDAIVLRMQEALQECEDAFGTDAEMRMAEMQDNPWALVNDPELTEDQQNAVLYYINAKAAMDGVQDASNDAMENKRREVAANVERHTHKDNGMVQPATMKVDDKPVYIVKGNVAVLPDGTGIDTQNSDQSIVICDAETGEYKFISPDQIFNLGDAIDPQAELDEAYANIQAEHEAVLGGMENGESVPKSGESVHETPENVQNEGENVQQPMTDEQLQQYAQGAFNEATQGDGGVTLPQEQVEQMQQRNQQMLEQDQQRREEEANRQPTALERVPLNEGTGEPMFEKADKETALDALNEVTGGNEANTTAIVNAQVEQAQKTLDALKKKQPTKKAPSLKGSPMAMVKAQQEADANYNAAMEQYNAQVAEAEETLGAWSRIYALMNERKRAIREQREAEQRERDKQMHDAAVAQVEEQKRIAAQKAAEQAEVGTHAVNPKIKAKWDGAAKVEGNPNALTLADGSTIRGHYVLTEAGAASASHDVNNAFEPTEGFPIDENGESVNDRDYKRDTDAQRIVRDIANSYDSRALQSPVIVSKDGVVLSGNNRTMSGDIAAQQGTDKAYIDHLREFGQMYGFTSEQIDGMKHPRVVFVPDEQLPYDATTFARFNAEQQKKQSKPEHAVKLGKIVPDNVFTSITNDISRFDRLSDYYADDKAVSSAISQLLGAGVINEMQLPEMRTGNSLSAAGKELIENTLIGKVFQTSPDAVRHIISTPTLRQSVIMGLNEIAHNRTLAKSGYDLSNELGAAVDLVARAKSAHSDIFKDGMPVSPFGREQGLFDDEYGDSRVTDGTTLLLADILNSGKPSDLRKVLSAYNAQATAPAGGQLDMFTGDVTSKEEILNTINEHFRNATPKEQQAIIDAAIAERKRIAETEAGQRGGNEATEQTEDAVQRSAEPQQPAVAETEPAKQEETPQTEEPNADTIAEEEEEALRKRITETDEEWTEPSANGDIYKQKLLIDGKEVIKVDAPDESKNYPGTYYEVDGKQFGDLQEVVRHFDGAEQPLSAKIKTASADVNTEPTEAQKEAGEPKEAMNNAMAERVNELAERLHTPVRIIRTDEEVAALPSTRQRRMKGSFNPLTGEVTIVVPNNANMADVENTFIHEVVGHDGLCVLFPEEEKLNNALDELYNVSKDEIRNTIDRNAQKMYDAEVDRLREKKRKEHEANGEDSNASYYADMAEAHAEASKKREQFKRDATEEYGADLAGRIGEKGFEKMSADELTFWGKLKSMLQKALQKLLEGLKIPGKKKWGDKEWAFVLHEAYKRKKNGGKPDVFDAADTEVMRRKTGFGETKFSDGHKKSAQPNEAALKHLEPTDVEHAAKVQQKREKAKEALANVAKTYKNTTDSKGFISDLSNSLGLTRGSTGSGYGSFETPNGKVFTIRVSNHNINAANVGDEPVESIVIKTKRSPNRFHAEDGKFANEYVYFKEDIRKAPAGTLSAIAESISDLLDTGEYHDKTGLAKDNHSPETDPDGGMKFRDGDMGLDETITQMKIAASQANADNWQAKQEAMKAISGNLNKLRQAMARQREYDLSTVKSITDLAKVLLDNGLLDDLSKYETKRILSAVNNAHGKQDTSNQVAKVMDIMVDNQLRMGANMLGRLLSTRGSRVDARGIEVQGQLDPDGQTIAQVVRKATSLPKSDIEERIAEALNRMGSDDQAVADEAALEYSGLLLAHQFAEDITDSKAEEKALRDSIKQAKEDLDAGMMEKDAYNEYVAATNDAIRQNKIERAEAYRSIVEQVGSVLGGSVERAKQWREAEKQRVEAIHHNANSDMEGRPTDEHHKEGKEQKIANNSAVRFLLAPLGTFDQMLRMFGKKSVNGEGYLWNRYMRGWVDATEREYKGYQNALKTLDEKVSDVFGKKMQWGDLFAMERKMPKATVTFWDGGEKKDHELTQGNLLYIYMVDKMADGRMKLRRMGITEEDVENIKDFVDPRFLQLADWMQEEFLVGKRNEYNEVHKRMFGASMAAIENYFPLKILANARIEDVDVADDTTDTALPATSTGSIIKRRRNNLALDVMGADAFSVILDHVQQMERWAAFAEFNRDLNTLLSYKHFRNQVMNMSSVYGGGKTLWNNFRNVCSMAAGAYRPPIAQLDKAAVNIAKGVTAAKVSFRVFTALKQFLSMPAYLSDSNPVYLAANIANPIGAWKWSMENLPLFEKRWKSRMAGDPRLMKSEMDWKMWRSHVVEIASRIGMSPNAFVDALTVAIGSHAMYKTKKDKYLRYGYDEETAEKRAKQDATILFNQTQQSSESAFLSTMQVDRSWKSVVFTVFRNSNMSYTRKLYDALRNIKHRFEPGYKEMSEEFMAKQMRRDGIDPDKADNNAKREYRRSLLHNMATVGVFGFIVQMVWNLGAYLPYFIAGDDKDQKNDMWDDAFKHSFFGSIEGLTGGDVMSAVGNDLIHGKGLNLNTVSKEMPISSDIQNVVRKWNKDNVAAMNDVVNLLVQSGFGVNPQSLTDAVVAIMDYCGDDAETSRECALLIARIINCPQSQTDKIYFDELGATAAEASKMTPAEIAERYAEYKIHRGAPLTGWAYSEEARDSVKTAQQNRVLTKAKEKMSNRMETETTKQLLSTYDEVSKQQTELSKLKKTDRTAYREGMKQLRQKYNMREHGRMKRYKHDMKLLTEKYLRSKSAEERDSLVRVMTTTRDKLLDDIGRMNQQ